MMKTPRRFLRVLFMVVLLFLTTNTVYANAGTGLFGPAIIQLLIGNIMIGLIEAFFVRKAFKIPARYGTIILANYASMIFGYVAVAVGFPDDALTFYTPAFAGKMLPILFIASVFIEWPFFAGAVKDRPLGFTKTSFKYTLYAQCVSYVLLVPFYFLPGFDEGRFQARNSVEMDLNNLAVDAYRYRLRPRVYGGGGVSYDGFSVAGENGRYFAVTYKDSIVFLVYDTEAPRRAIEVKEPLASVVLDSMGNLHSWTYRIKPADTDSGDVPYRLKFWAGRAYEFRMRPRLVRGGNRSYSGYTIPENSSVGEFARYEATSSKDSIVFVAVSIESTRTIVSVVVDSTGRLHSWKWNAEIE